MGCSTPGLPVPHYLLESAQVRVHWMSDAINHLVLCHPLLLFWGFKYLSLLFCDPWVIWKVLLFSKCVGILHLLLISARKACGQRAQTWIIPCHRLPSPGVIWWSLWPSWVSDVPSPLCSWPLLHPVFFVFMVASLEWVSSYLSCVGVNVLPEEKVLCLSGILEKFQPFFCWLLLQLTLCLTFSHQFPSLTLLLMFVF